MSSLVQDHCTRLMKLDDVMRKSAIVGIHTTQTTKYVEMFHKIIVKLEELISCIIDICVCLVGHDVTIELSINNIQPDSCNYTVELAMC